MEFCVFTEPQQGATYADLAAVAVAAEEVGFDGFFRSDHWLKMGSVSGLPGPTDAWVTLGAIARETSTIRLGTLVNSMTFRLPGPLAITVAQVDEMSGGRAELGLGTGWYADEHSAYGIDFPPLGTRFDMLEEQLAIITGLWTTADDDTFSFAGTHYKVQKSPALPKPTQRPTPAVIVGGGGPRRTAGLAARFATEYNRAFASAQSTEKSFANVRQQCEEFGRDPASLKYSAALVLCVGETEADVERRAARIGRDVDELRLNGAAGTPDEVVAKLASYAEAGADRLYLQVLDLTDLDHIGLAADAVLPYVS